MIQRYFGLIAPLLATLTLASCGGNDPETTSKGEPSRAASTESHGAAHDGRSTPAESEKLAAQPLNVTLNFDTDRDLARSSVNVTGPGGEAVTTGKLVVVGNGTSLQQPLRAGVPEGEYSVSYDTCSTGGACEDAKYTFTIDRSLSDGFIDMRGKSQVTIDMKDIKFVEQEVVVSPGTKVTWVNSDTVDHYVNTDTHPAHTYYPAQNSRGISTSEQYSVTFTKTGVYPYHCSAHTDMTATLVVA